MIYFGFLLILFLAMSSNSANVMPKPNQNRHKPRVTAADAKVTFDNMRRTSRNGRLDNMAMKLLELDNVFELADILNTDVRETATEYTSVPKSAMRQSIADVLSQKEQRYVNEEEEPVGNYDKNGMIYLTKKKNRGSQNVNSLMEKVIKYKLRSNEKGNLRQPFNKVFTRSEVDALKKIVRAIDEEDVAEKRERVPSNPRVEVFDFADLVV